MEKKVRVRFAPSPTGGLHLGGVRTVLFNYLFAKKHNGTFIVRIEDTDQRRYVPGAEEYLFECLRWCGLEPDESVQHGGAWGPYRQSERKALYKKYADELIDKGWAYYGFDTPEELEQMRTTLATPANPSPQYDRQVRQQLRNSLSLGPEKTKQLLEAGTPYVVRIKMPEQETLSFTDLIRGEVSFDTATLDDKVLLKADGMPTYHLAVVVDDFQMQITHAFRGEEWLPSAPVHILLWKYLFGIENMPQWAHLPLILGPHGKLSKRDGAKYGFPVFAMNWADPVSGEITEGFKEKGFLPEAFINLLALLGWNDGSEKENFSLQELIDAFSIERIHSAGARFDYEKAKWFNHEWIKKSSVALLLPAFEQRLLTHSPAATDREKLIKIIALVKDRCILLTDIDQQAGFFFTDPPSIDTAAITGKWSTEKRAFFEWLAHQYSLEQATDAAMQEQRFKDKAAENQLKAGELLLPFRIMLVGGKFGPGVFDIATVLGPATTAKRITYALSLLP
ncbi:MAG: glutamate--tRNA ligase [Sphingomonadales bacterium]